MDTSHLLLAIIIEDGKRSIRHGSQAAWGSGAQGGSFLGLPVTEGDAQAAQAWLCGRRRRSSRGRRSPQLLFSAAAKTAFEHALEVTCCVNFGVNSS